MLLVQSRSFWQLNHRFKTFHFLILLFICFYKLDGREGLIRASPSDFFSLEIFICYLVDIMLLTCAASQAQCTWSYCVLRLLFLLVSLWISLSSNTFFLSLVCRTSQTRVTMTEDKRILIMALINTEDISSVVIVQVHILYFFLFFTSFVLFVSL